MIYSRGFTARLDPKEQETPALFRENPDRCIYVQGEINAELVDKLLPQIQTLRLKSLEPITVYLHSVGGSVLYADMLYDLLTAPNQDKKRCRIITVAPATTGSTATDLLTRGDYAMAYPSAMLHYHGVSRQMDARVNKETATTLAENLARHNEEYALQLARKVLPRLVTLCRYVYKVSPDNTTDLIRKMYRGLSSRNDHLVHESVTLLKRAAEARTYARDALKYSGQASDVEKERRILLSLVDQVVESKKKETAASGHNGWSLRQGGLAEIVDAFNLYWDYETGKYISLLKDVMEFTADDFLDQGKKEEYSHLQDDEARSAWLKENVQPKLRPLIYYVVSFCRLLKRSEYYFTAKDAFMLGLIDEVVGEANPRTISVEAES